MSNAEKRPSHTPGPWVAEAHTKDETLIFDGNGFDEDPLAIVCLGQPEAAANARLIAAAPSLLEAIKVQHECGEPSKVSLYDGEGVEGWKWAHPDGREWVEAGDWSAPPPMHPVAREAIARAEGGAE